MRVRRRTWARQADAGPAAIPPLADQVLMRFSRTRRTAMRPAVRACEVMARARNQDPEADERTLSGSFLTWALSASLSDIGGYTMYFALGWAATGHGGTAAGIVLSAITIPRTVLLLLGGATADRLGPRAVMIAGDAGLLLVTSALAVAAWLLGTPLWLLLVAAIAEGTVSAFYLPASGSMPRRLVPDAAVPRALAVRQTGMQVANMSGGPLGGVLVAGIGFSAAVAANAVTYVPVLLVMVFARSLRPSRASSDRSFTRDLASGVVVALSRPLLRVGLALAAATVAVVIPTESVLVPLLVRVNGWGAALAGIILGSESVGGVAVAITVARLGAAARAGKAALGGLAVTAAGLLLLGYAPSGVFAIVAGVTCGAGTAVFTSHAFPLILTGTPPAYLSRVQSLLSLAQAGTLVVAAPLVGVSANHLGVSNTLTIGAALLVLVSVAAFLVPSWRSAKSSDASPAKTGRTDP